MSYWIIWLVVVILLCVIELCTVNLVSVWFVASGILALFTSLFTQSFLIQFGVFVILGIIFLLITRPLIKKVEQKEQERTNLERIIGMKGIVTEDILENQVGEVKVDGKLWSAISNEDILKDEPILVKKIDSVKLVVERVLEEKKKPTQQKKVTKSSSQKQKKTSSTSKKTNNSKKASSSKKTTGKTNSQKQTRKKGENK